ncbi:S1 RNA-binding domain-containing protein [Psychrobacillus sp. FSL H8-0484]|uniref:S1 RNA-binding domain-containing protein n=1 Tax=Psychrobacillus sp. FSL H8-0484 TaxID=2921390 RepID=UPI0030F7CF61
MVQKQQEIQVAQTWADLRQANNKKAKKFILKANVVGLEDLSLGTKKEQALKMYYEGIYGYIPISKVDDYEFKSLQMFVGTQLDFIVEGVFEDKEGEGKFFLGNRKEALEILAESFWRTADVGQEYEAFVSGVDKYGVYLVIEGVRTRMEREDYSYTFVKDLQEEVFIGDTLDVRITKVDKEAKRIEVSRKVLEQDPKEFLKEYKLGGFYAGTIINIDVDAGIFVRLEPRNITGRSNIPAGLGKRLLKEGEQVNFKVTDINQVNGRVNGLVIIPRVGQTNKQKGKSNGR